MKILLINSVFEKGSTGKIVENLYQAYTKANNDVHVIYGRGKKVNNNKNIKRVTLEFESKFFHLLSLLSGNMYGGLPLSTYRIIKQIKKIKPDMIHIHCLNGYFVNMYKLLRFIAKNKYKTILTMHADFMMTGGCGYSINCNKYIDSKCSGCNEIKKFNSKFSLKKAHRNYKKLENSISDFKTNLLKITCVSPWLTTRYKESKIYRNFKVCTIINPVDDTFINSKIAKTKNKQVLYVTPDICDKTKCGYLLPKIAEILTDYRFVVVDAKNNNLDSNLSNIEFVGHKNNTELAKLYSESECTLLLSKRETFSMVVAESLACGTPVVGFKSGGPETIGIPKYSLFCKHGNITELASQIQEITIKKFNKVDIKKDASTRYNKAIISMQYLQLFD